MLDTPIGVWQKICIPNETFLFLKRYICSGRAEDSSDAAAERTTRTHWRRGIQAKPQYLAILSVKTARYR